jgi:hypothetical protein
LYAEPGWWFNLLLLDTADTIQDYAGINERADTAIDFDERDEKTPWRLIVGLHHLVKARALSGKADWGAANWCLNEAFKNLEDSGTVLHLADARLTRAEVFRQKMCHEGRGDPTAALDDVGEALVIANKCGMHLVRVDALLLKAKLLLDSVPKRGFRKKEEKLNEAVSCYNDVKAFLQDIGYSLREAEVLILNARLHYHQNLLMLATR